MTVDVLISDIEDVSIYDGVIILRGWSEDDLAYRDLLDSSDALDLISVAVDLGIPVCAGCGGVRVLARAGVLDGIHVQGQARFKDEYEAAGAIWVGNKIPPVIDGNIITTTRGMYYSYENAQALALLIESKSYIASIENDYHNEINDNYILNCDSDIGNGRVNVFGTSQADGGRSVCRDDNGDNVIVGYTYTELNNSDIFVIKTSSNGDVIWSKTFGSIN